MLPAKEIQSLSKLLCSGDSQNMKLGFELLRAHLDLLEAVAIPVHLFLEFESLDDWEETEQYKDQWTGILESELPAGTTDRLKRQFQVLKWADDEEQVGKDDFLSALREFQGVEAIAKPCLESNPRYIGLYAALGKSIFANLGNRQEACQYYEKLVAAAPENLNYQLQRINFLINECFGEGLYLDELGATEQVLRLAMERIPRHRGNYLTVIAMLHDLYHRNKPVAKALYQEVLEADPENSTALNNLAVILYKTEGNWEAALPLAQAAVKVSPEKVSYLDTLAWIHWKGFQNIKEAERWFRECRRFDSSYTHHASLTGLGEVLEAKGDYQKALRFYDDGLSLRPDSLYKLQKLADLCYFKLRQKGRAYGYYERILKIDPDHPHAKEMLAKEKEG